jgi:hypothetical protein
MSNPQFGMQMPGGRAKRGGSPDVFTGLAALAVLFLGVACFAMFQAASKVSPDGSPFSLQDPKKITLPKK